MGRVLSLTLVRMVRGNTLVLRCVCMFIMCVQPLTAAVNVQSLPRTMYLDTLIALYGQYSEIYILDSETLDVSFSDFVEVWAVRGFMFPGVMSLARDS